MPLETAKYVWFIGGLFIGAASIRVIGACAIWFFLPQFRLTVFPPFVALTYLGLVITIPIERKKWESKWVGT